MKSKLLLILGLMLLAGTASAQTAETAKYRCYLYMPANYAMGCSVINESGQGNVYDTVWTKPAPTAQQQYESAMSKLEREADSVRRVIDSIDKAPLPAPTVRPNTNRPTRSVTFYCRPVGSVTKCYQR